MLVKYMTTRAKTAQQNNAIQKNVTGCFFIYSALIYGQTVYTSIIAAKSVTTPLV
jgi:hypothetical protein